MPTLTVQAADSSTAMEEIAQKLGADAMILSTTKQNGKIIMQATNDLPSSSEPGSSEAKPALSTTDFDRLFAAKLGKDVAKSGIDLSGVRSDNASSPRPAPSQLASSRPASRPAPQPQTASQPALPSAAALNQSEIMNALCLMADRLEDMDRRMAGMMLTSLDGLNDTLQDSTPVQLRRAGFAENTISRLQASYAGLGYEAGVSSFLEHLGGELAVDISQSLMKKRVYFIIGPTGSGRTTLAAKLAASLKDEHSGRVVALTHLASSSAETDSKLKSYARLLNLPFCHLTDDVPVQHFDKMTDFDMMVVDVTLAPDQAVGQLQALRDYLGHQDVATIMTLQGGSSSSLIKQYVSGFSPIEPLIALTKLDECETTPAEFSTLADNQAHIALLSGTKSVVGALAFASGKIMGQYLKENFSADQLALAR